MAANVGDPIRDVYIALDNALGKLLPLIDEDVNVLVYSSHGAAAERTGTGMLDDILLRIEQAWNSPQPKGHERPTVEESQPPASTSLLDTMASFYKKIVPSKLRKLRD